MGEFLVRQEFQSGTVLVADDNEGCRRLFRDLLEDQGYKVVCASDGDEALDCFSGVPFDVALLDVMMPRRTGFSVCRAVKTDARTRLVPVVLVTGLDNVEDRVQGIECGADDFLSKPINEQELLARVRSLVKLKQFTDELESSETVLFTLARSIEAKDPYTEGHYERLSKYSVSLARRLSLPENDQVSLRLAGIVHDIGKIAVPDQILCKPGPLTPEERKIMEQHPVTGERICSPLKLFRGVLPIIRHHHERLDGSGYPDGLKGDEIPLTARILTAVDIYDALTTDRPYRKAFSRDQAFAQIKDEVKRGWWDAALIEELEGSLQSVCGRPNCERVPYP